MFSSFGGKINSHKHSKILSYLYVFYGGLLFVFTCIFAFFINQDQRRMAHAKIDPSLAEKFNPDHMFSMMWKIDLFILVCSVLAFTFAYGIKYQKRWATAFLGYILGLFLFVQVPFGTLLGIYTLWFLVQYEKSI